MGEIEATAAAERDGAHRHRGTRIPPGLLIAASCIVVAIIAVAIFGGFTSVTRPGSTEYRIDEPFVSSQLDIVVERVAVIDELGTSAAYPDRDAGERVLAVLIEVTNLDSEPRSASDVGSLSAIRLDHRTEDRPSVSIYGDNDFSTVTLQPDVPARVLLTWVVGRGEVARGDEVRLVIPDSEKTDSTLFRGESLWFDLESRIDVTAPVEDLGAGNAEGRL